MKEQWQLDPVFRQEFLDACKHAAEDDEAFKHFRENDRIKTVIENTPKWWADKALEAMGMTPTMVRYWYILELIERLVGRFPRDSRMVEIGAGYGGLCKLIIDKWVTQEYIIHDLHEATLLQQRYLVDECDTVQWASGPNFSIEGDLCISWCAWSELALELRKEYAEKVISKCRHFFICSNYNMEEDIEILRPYFSVIKTYSDELVSNVVYG